MCSAGTDLVARRRTSADFPRSQVGALLACDLLEAVTLSGARLHAFAAIGLDSRRTGPRRHRPPSSALAAGFRHRWA
ncbi:hypothetical protein OG900_01135 [Streptomyces sp. NBC_00433]